MEILVSANLSADIASDFEKSVIEFLRSRGASVNVFNSDDYTMIRSSTANHQTVPHPAEVPEPNVSDAPQDLPEPVEQNSPQDLAIELPLNLASSEDPADNSTSDEIPSQPTVPVTPLEGEVCLRDLSSLYAVPFSVDLNKQFTELKVKELSDLGDHVSFVYCGLVFKFPVPPSINGIVNSPVPPSSMSVRAMVEFVGSSIDLQPVLFNLVECAENESHCVVFGADMIEVVSSAIEKKASSAAPIQGNEACA